MATLERSSVAPVSSISTRARVLITMAAMPLLFVPRFAWARTFSLEEAVHLATEGSGAIYPARYPQPL